MSKRARRLAAGLFPLQVEILENRLLLSAAATTTALAASSNPILLGQVIALTATVSSPGGSPDAGTVSFMDGTTLIGTANVDSSTDQAIGFTDTLALGTHNLTAIYNGTTGFNTSTSSAITETVDPTSDANPNTDITTTTTLTSSQGTINVGQVVALVANVTATSGSPTGIVSFFDGSTLIGTVSVTSGQAVGYTASLTLGTHAITAAYDGASGFATSTSPVLTQTVSASVNTTTTIVASSNPITQGQFLAITATVAGGATTGSVTFNDGTTDIGTVAIDPTTGQAVGFWNTLAAGTHNITATYGGSPGFALSTSSALSLVINKNVSTTTTLMASSNPIVIGQLIAITANVSGAGGIPTGTVTFNDGSTVIGAVAVDPTGHAVGFTSFTTSGIHNITATYSGDTGYAAGTSSVVAETVNLVGADTSTTLTIFPSPGVAGQPVAFIATVTSASGTPTGTVTFMEGSTLFGTVTIDPTTHQAIGFTNGLTAGTYSITATYNGSATFAGSVSSPASEVVNPVGTLTTNVLTTSSSALVFGQVVAMTATITAASGSPTGSVTFMDGTTPIGTVAVNATTHEAIGFSAGLIPGMHSLTAIYTGANGFANSTSAVIHVTVNPDATATTLRTSGNNVTAGGFVQFTATITAEAPGGGSPTGTVTFMDGSTLIGTATVSPVSNTNTAIANDDTISLTPGAHSITAVYSPLTGYSASTSAVLTETIVGIATTTTVTASTASVTIGQTVTFTATVAGTGVMPTGTVTFTSGSTALGTATLNGTGTATTSEYNLNTGTYPVTATYSGDSIHATSVSTGSTSFAVTTPTFTTVSLDGSSYQTATATTGAGLAAADGQLVSVEYTLYLSDGTLSQTSVGSAPFQFALGEGSTVAGFDAGVDGMKTGEVRVLVLQPAVGYGANPPSGIPANEVLTFIVKMVGVDQPRLTVSSGTTTPVPVTFNETPSTTDGTDFGSATVGLSTAPSVFTLGDADSSPSFTLTSTQNPIIQVIGADPNDFVITQPSTLVGGTFTIAFLPTATGVRTATIKIATNDPDVPNFTFNVTGIGA